MSEREAYVRAATQREPPSGAPGVYISAAPHDLDFARELAVGLRAALGSQIPVLELGRYREHETAALIVVVGRELGSLQEVEIASFARAALSSRGARPVLSVLRRGASVEAMPSFLLSFLFFVEGSTDVAGMLSTALRDQLADNPILRDA